MRDGAKLERAKELRRDSTLAERRLWEQLRRKTLDGCKFVRQEPIGPFIVDFVCRPRKLIVEVDDATHSTDEELASDERRTAYPKRDGYTVIRVQNDDILDGMDEVLTIIREALHSSSPVYGRGQGPVRQSSAGAQADGKGEGWSKTEIDGCRDCFHEQAL